MSQLAPYFNAQWSNFYARLLVGCTLGIAIMLATLFSGQMGFLPLGASVLLFTAYFYAGASWYLRHKLDHARLADGVWSLLELRPHESFVYVEPGYRNGAIAISKQLQKGHVFILDVFNPQQMPDPALARLRFTAYNDTILPLSDPRTVWREGEIGRFPLRENSTRAVVIEQTLSALVQHGDRRLLLQEALRVLKPGGKLIVVEPVQRSSNRWLIGFGQPYWIESWRGLLEEAHFVMVGDRPINALLHAFHAIKPAQNAYQLRLDI